MGIRDKISWAAASPKKTKAKLENVSPEDIKESLTLEQIGELRNIPYLVIQNYGKNTLTSHESDLRDMHYSPAKVRVVKGQLPAK